jgi:hypothetical protein
MENPDETQETLSLHPGVASLLRFFSYEHLPENLQEVSKPLAELAQHVAYNLPDGPEKTAGLRKLLEAKDCFVRAAI